jgi:hypothetical protein
MRNNRGGLCVSRKNQILHCVQNDKKRRFVILEELTATKDLGVMQSSSFEREHCIRKNATVGCFESLSMTNQTPTGRHCERSEAIQRNSGSPCRFATRDDNLLRFDLFCKKSVCNSKYRIMQSSPFAGLRVTFFFVQNSFSASC